MAVRPREAKPPLIRCARGKDLQESSVFANVAMYFLNIWWMFPKIAAYVVL